MIDDDWCNPFRNHKIWLRDHSQVTDNHVHYCEKAQGIQKIHANIWINMVFFHRMIGYKVLRKNRVIRLKYFNKCFYK